MLHDPAAFDFYIREYDSGIHLKIHKNINENIFIVIAHFSLIAHHNRLTGK